MRVSKEEREQLIGELREELKPGMYLHSILRHVSRSGMSRSISTVLIKKDLSMRQFDYAVEVLLGFPMSPYEGNKVQGAGMDMGYHVVYALGRVLYPKGFECIGDKCPSNDHSNGDRDYTPHHHTDGGYAFKHGWL